MVGDSVWDVGAGARAGIPVLGLRCGGFSEAELVEAGGVVFDDPEDLARAVRRDGPHPHQRLSPPASGPRVRASR